MSTLQAGTSKKGFMSRDDYLAPLAIPTGQSPKDVLNTIWRKNDVFIDIGDYSVGSFVMMVWPLMLLFGVSTVYEDLAKLDIIYWFGFFCFIAFPIIILVISLIRPVPLPVRFNRQRREVCVPQKDGSYWIVPWETVTAAATQTSFVSQAGKTTQGLLVVGFKNPDPDAKKGKTDWSMGFNCGGGSTAMSLWECMRSYMEADPADVPHAADLGSGSNLKYYVDYMKGKASQRGWFLTIMWEGILGVFIFNAPLSMYLQRKKLFPPPDLTDPTIIEWSKPLPPEQWAKRSPELDLAIKQREAELEIIHAEEAAKEAAYRDSLPKSTRPEKSNWPTE
ncbi:DUF6708 domain-containing protein [Pseudomonas sp. MS19]|uniref:DUF6708 domain-containing protein n=1 Tax=Pseudomonas sp. MS19 TaxID=2579939 RepID=UPI001F5BD1EB|nr:DUF6708 domain-containing protein [Pseudomonas sp. MS19]